MTALTKKQILHDILTGVMAGALSIAMMNAISCKRVTSNPSSNGTAPNFYAQAAQIMNDYSSIMLSAQNLFSTAHTEGLVTDTEYQAGQKVFLTVGEDGQAIDKLIQAGASQDTIIAQCNALSATIATMPQAFAIKNPQSQAEFTALANSLTSLLNTVATLIQSPATGGAK
jgi:hypothetical protein